MTRIVNGLTKHYGFDRESEDIRYWTLHMGVDEEHMKVGPLAVERYAVTEPQQAACAHRCRKLWTSFGSHSTASSARLSIKIRSTRAGATEIRRTIQMEMVDLSRVIYDGMPKIPILPEVHVRRISRAWKRAIRSTSRNFLACHAGTHVDAPIHIVAKRQIDRRIAVDAFVGIGRGDQRQEKRRRRSDGQGFGISGVAVNRGDILCSTPAGTRSSIARITICILTFGRCRRMDGQEGHQNVRHRLHNRGPADTAAAQGIRFSVHRTLLGNNVLIAENVTNLASILGKRRASWHCRCGSKAAMPATRACRGSFQLVKSP